MLAGNLHSNHNKWLLGIIPRYLSYALFPWKPVNIIRMRYLWIEGTFIGSLVDYNDTSVSTVDSVSLMYEKKK